MPAWNPRANEIFFAALEIEDLRQREYYLDAACGGDVDLRRQVRALLSAHDHMGDFLENPVPAGTIDQPVREAVAIPPGLSDPSPETPAEGRGTRIGPYKLLQQIGEGGMGSVWMAEQHEPIHRIVALKIIKADLGSSQVIARFEAERQALALMDHPNIARVFDGGTTGGRPYFVMELVKGTPITKHCDQHRLTIPQRLELFVQVCQALQHAHQKGIIHRDIKPSNVLVAPYDGRPVVKVIDFGVAKATGQKLTDKTMFTEVGAVVGTMQYMSPEQAELNNQDIDTRSDIYSLGVLLYELLTGTTPLDVKRLRGAMMAAMLMAIQEEEPPKPSTRLSESKDLLPSISAQRQMEPAKLTRSMRGDLDWIVMKALAKERNRRYETANSFAADVERFLHDEPVSAGPPTVGYKLRKFVHRNRGQVIAAAALLFALLAGITVSTWQAVRATRAEGVALEEQGNTAQALTVAEHNWEEAEGQRKKAETLANSLATQAASLAVDLDLKYCGSDEVNLGLLRLAQTLRTIIPEHAKELRECAALNILAWGQQLFPAGPALDHDGYRPDQILLSPDGLTVLTRSPDGKARLWNTLNGKQRAILTDVWPMKDSTYFPLEKQLQFSIDGRTALTLHSHRAGSTGVDGTEADDWTVRLWDVDTGNVRVETATHPGQLNGIQLSRNNALLVTRTSRVSKNVETRSWVNTIFAWDATNGQLIRKLEIMGFPPQFDVSPDGTSVLIGTDNSKTERVQVWFPKEANSPKLLFQTEIPSSVNCTPYVLFSPSGRSAFTASGDGVRWWNTSDWELQQKNDELTSYSIDSSYKDLPVFVHENIVKLDSNIESVPACVVVKGLREPILNKNKNECRVSPDGALIAFDADEVYETRSGQRLPLPRGRKFNPELRQFTNDGRFGLFPNAFLADLDVAKKIGSGAVSNFLVNQNAWIGIGFDSPNSSNWITLVPKVDASLDATLLEKWCQVITRGKLDEGGRYTKLHEASWEKLREDLFQQLPANKDAEIFRVAAADRVYWLRKECEVIPRALPLTLPNTLSPSPPLQFGFFQFSRNPLFDRLIAAEPTWPNYSWRAVINCNLGRWSDAIRDDLEAARLAGEHYWLHGSPFTRGHQHSEPGISPQMDWELGDRLVRFPGRPHEEYNLTLRWAEARSRGGIGGDPARTTTIALALFRLGRYLDALATLQKRDVPTLLLAAGTLTSPWNLLAAYGLTESDAGTSMELKSEFKCDPIDLSARAMCYHHLKQPQAANSCLNQAHELLGKEDGDGEVQAFLREAETLIEGKVRP